MKYGKASRLLGVIACLILWPAFVSAQETSWDTTNAAGLKALNEGRYSEAEELFSSALRMAETFGEQDPRFATSFNNLAELYRNQGQYA